MLHILPKPYPRMKSKCWLHIVSTCLNGTVYAPHPE
jgi:hypothetical protein